MKLEHIPRKFTLALFPAILCLLLVFAAFCLSNFGKYYFFLIIFGGLIYACHRIYLSQYWKEKEFRVREFGETSRDSWGTFYLYGLAAFPVIFGAFLLLHQGEVAAAIGLFAAGGFLCFVVRQRRDLQQRSVSLRDYLSESPPAIHAELSTEIAKWREADILDKQQSVNEVLELSALIVSEGHEVSETRADIETFYAGPMKNLIVALGSLRRMVRGESYLTDEQTKKIDVLKSDVDRHKDELKALYQRIAG